MRESLIPVDGMLTVHCARNVEAVLKRLPGVHHAESQVSLDEIQAAVRDCGYVCEGGAAEHAEHEVHAGHAMPGMEAHEMPHKAIPGFMMCPAAWSPGRQVAAPSLKSESR